MADHAELVNEMQMLENLSTQERLKQAKKRRMQQLKKWNQREKEFVNQAGRKSVRTTPELNKENDQNASNNRKRRKGGRVCFVNSVMLLEAASRNDLEEVRRLLQMNVDPDSTNEDGLTALHQVSIDGTEEMMKLLIEFGANVNARDLDQWTPLHAAATCGNLQLVKYLISKDADLLAVNADGNMPYDICEHEATLDYIEHQMAARGITQQQIDETRLETEMKMLQFLREKIALGIPLESIEFEKGATALHVAAANGYLDVVVLLLEQQFSPHVEDEDLWQPIHAAACWGHPDVLELLVQAGADLNARTKTGETPLDICEDPELKERIVKLKNDIETRKLQMQKEQAAVGFGGPHRLKRSHSQNTRSQSVRRTSLREKSQISRREAREEARLRQNSSDEDVNRMNRSLDISHLNQDSNQDTISLPLDQVDRSLEESPLASRAHDTIPPPASVLAAAATMSTYELPPPSLINERPIDCNGIESSSFDDSKLSRIVRNELSLGDAYATNGNYSNMGTLADLKKQRAGLRKRFELDEENNGHAFPGHLLPSNQSSPAYVSSNPHRFTTINGKEHTSSLYRPTTVYSSNQPPPSPSCTLKKFCGDPSDVVGEINKKGCCALM